MGFLDSNGLAHFISEYTKKIVQKKNVLTAEEIEASTDLTGKVAGAQAVKDSTIRRKTVTKTYSPTGATTTATYFYKSDVGIPDSATIIAVNCRSTGWAGIYPQGVYPAEDGSYGGITVYNSGTTRTNISLYADIYYRL